MGVLINGVWTEGSSGFRAAPGRYHLNVAHGCPCAVRGVKRYGWACEDNPAFPDCSRDHVNGFQYLCEAYSAASPRYAGKIAVPTLRDRKTRSIVSNESSEIIWMLNSESNAITGDTKDYYPSPLRAEIDRLNAKIHCDVNNGVYRCGFAKSQAAYDEAYGGLFATLDEMEVLPGTRRYLAGDTITGADRRLFPTLVRFGVACFSIFNRNRQRIADCPNLSNYTRDLHGQPGVAATVKPRYHVINYYTIPKVHPAGVVPKGTPADFSQPHDRARLAARCKRLFRRRGGGGLTIESGAFGHERRETLARVEQPPEPAEEYNGADRGLDPERLARRGETPRDDQSDSNQNRHPQGEHSAFESVDRAANEPLFVLDAARLRVGFALRAVIRAKNLLHVFVTERGHA